MTYLADTDLVKAARTLHVPWSPGITSDDKVHASLDHLLGHEVVVTEKLDGENTTMTRVRVHARSLDSKDHWSRHRVKQLYTELKWKLDLPQFKEIHRICGENLQGVHSIEYSGMQGYFYCFGMFDRSNCRMSWDDMQILAEELNLNMAPLLARGVFTKTKNCEYAILVKGNLIKLDEMFTGTSVLGGEQEGWVLSLAESFHYDDYSKYVAKFVRANHVTTDEHWMKQSVRENKLKT